MLLLAGKLSRRLRVVPGAQVVGGAGLSHAGRVWLCRRDGRRGAEWNEALVYRV